MNGCRWKNWRLLFYGQISPKDVNRHFFSRKRVWWLIIFPHKIKQKHFFLEKKYETIPRLKKEAAVGNMFETCTSYTQCAASPKRVRGPHMLNSFQLNYQYKVKQEEWPYDFATQNIQASAELHLCKIVNNMAFPDPPWSDVFLIFSCFVKMHKSTLHHISHWTYLCLLSSLHMDQDLLLVLGWFKMKIFLNLVSCLQLHKRLSYERSDIFLCTHTPLNDLLMKKWVTWGLFKQQTTLSIGLPAW